MLKTRICNLYHLGTLLLTTLICLQVNASGNITLFISTDGQSKWSGALPEPNADCSDGPLPSVIAAWDLIRARRARGEWKNEPITVYIRGGTFFMDETLLFESVDSGSDVKPVVYAAYQDEQPILSGGRLINGWQKAEINGWPCWKVHIPEVESGQWYFRQLFVNDQRRYRPRVPAEGYNFLTEIVAETDEEKQRHEHDRVAFRPGDMKNWQDLSDIEYVSMEIWDESHVFLESVDEETHTVKFNIPAWFGTEKNTRTYPKTFEVMANEDSHTPGSPVNMGSRIASIIRMSHENRFWDRF